MGVGYNYDSYLTYQISCCLILGSKVSSDPLRKTVRSKESVIRASSGFQCWNKGTGRKGMGRDQRRLKG